MPRLRQEPRPWPNLRRLRQGHRCGGLILPRPDTGKLGFHSFRKTVIQTLQAAGVAAELRTAYVGHDLDDEHHSSYGMGAPKRQVLDAITRLDYPVSPATDAFT